jgi:Zn-dependent M28 family amino/carboxypeptidase
MSKRRMGVALLAIVAGAVFAGWALLTQPFVRHVEFSPPPVDAGRLEAHVRMLSETFHPRSAAEPAQLDAAARYIRQQLSLAGAAVDEQRYRVDGQEVRNLVARFGPAHGPLLVIGAHYDSHGHTPGADDNASGVAGLIELARLLAASPPPRAVELVAYTLEEPPHFRRDTMGSARHARALKQAGREVELMIALEMIGTFSDAPGSQHYPIAGLDWIYPDRGDFIAIVARAADAGATRRLKAAMRGATPLPVHSMNATAAIPGVDFSDHLNYWAEGWTAVMVTDTAFERNPHYHRAGDTAEKLDYRRMAQVVQGVFAATR